MKKTNEYKMIAVSGGFYFFGKEVPAPDGYYALTECSMSGGFSGGKGMPGVCRGDNEAQITLDRFEKDDVQYFPLTAVFAIFTSVNLYDKKSTTLR